MALLFHLVGSACIALYQRAAVYKRLKEGKLSVFLFHVTHRKTTLFGKNKILREHPYGYVPVSEARAWRRELEERALRQGLISEEELEGAKPDWHGEFLAWRNSKERVGLFDVFTPLEVVSGIASTLLRQKKRELKAKRKARPPRNEKA